jgi:Tubulin-tyrosine ligase family
MRHLVTEAFRAVAYKKIDPHRRNYTFEIFGFDFMIDDDFSVYLIEANTNPCLETNCPILSRLIPTMLDNSFKIALDPILPPPDLNFKRAHEAL